MMQHQRQRRRQDHSHDSFPRNDYSSLSLQKTHDVVTYRIGGNKSPLSDWQQYLHQTTFWRKLVILSVALFSFHFWMEHRQVRVTPYTNLPYTLFITMNLPISRHGNNIPTIQKIWMQHLDSIERSSFLGKNKSQLVIYYNTIGPSRLGLRSFAGACQRRNMECIHIQHYETHEQNETLSLLDLWKYCQEHDSKVAYYDFTPPERALSADTTSTCPTVITEPACWQAKASRCNVCGQDMDPFRVKFSRAGFVAQCTYVRKLLSPKDFVERLGVVYNLAHDGNESRFGFLLPTDPLRDFDPFRWVASHPDLLPCYVSNRTHTGIGPQHALKTDHDFAFWNLTNSSANLNDEDTRLKEYGLLAGRLFEWVHLYHKVPDETSSWVFTNFADGDYWRSMSKEHGVDIFANL